MSLRPCRLSKAVHSTALPPLRVSGDIIPYLGVEWQKTLRVKFWRAGFCESEYTGVYMDTLQKSSVLPVVGVVLVCVIGVVLIGLFGRGGSSTVAGETAAKLAIAVTAADHVLGDTAALVSIVEYADFQCPSCRMASPVLSKLVADESGKVSLVYRYFTLPQHLNAVPAAQAAEAAALQEKFWDMHDMLFLNQAEWENETDASKIFLGYAEKLGLDTAKFIADMQSEAVIARVKQDTADAMMQKLSHTPTMFINGTEMTTSPSYDNLKMAVEAAAAAKK